MPARGDRIEHPSFGPGVVRALADGGRKLRVEFDRLPGIPYILPVEQFGAAGAGWKRPEAEPLRARRRKEPGAVETRDAAPAVAPARSAPLTPPPPSFPPPPTTAKPEVLPVEAPAAPAAPPSARGFRADARQLFEALRMGVVPPALLDRYTVGREKETGRIRSFLQSGRGILVLEGHYGTGKTHMVELAASEARSLGFIASRVSFDSVEVPPSNPLRVYREVIHNLRYPPGGSGGGLAPLLSTLSRSKPHRTAGTPSYHRYLSPALFAIAEGDPEAVEAVLAFVEGRGGSGPDAADRAARAAGWRGPGLLALPDWRTFGQVYLYILGGVAAWARDAGHRGLVILFDEAESIEGLEKTSRDFADTFLRYFAAATLPESALAFRPEELYRGGHEVHRGIPHVYRDDQPLAGLFAFTPLPRVGEAIATILGGRERIVPLDPLTSGDLPLLAEKLIALHGEAYPGTALDGKTRERLLGHIRSGARDGWLSTTRAVARLAVEVLDLARHGRDAASALNEAGQPPG